MSRLKRCPSRQLAAPFPFCRRSTAGTAGQPRASIETPLHSMLPFDQVDHTHPDAIIALCAVPEGPEMAQRLWGGRAIWVDYERPGFSLGKRIAMAVRERPDAACVLMAKHGLVTWAD